MEGMALDIFRTDDFRATTMTEMVADIDYVPYELDALGIFEPEYLNTTTVTLYQENGELNRIPTTERGTPEPTADRRGRVLRQFDGHRLAKRDIVRSHEVQDILSAHLPQPVRLQNANDLVTERQSRLLDDLNYTKEFHRLGALQGTVYDADGVSLVDDWYEAFGISRPAAITFDFSKFVAVEDQGKLRAMVDADINTPMQRALKRRMRPGTRPHALVGDDFWAALTASPAYERSMLTDAGRVTINDSRLWNSVDLGGVVWHHYFGSDDKALTIADDEAIFFPVGAKDVFKAYFMPGENFAEANQRGQEEYSIISWDYRPNMLEWVEIYVKSYPVFACLCPQALMRAVLG
jgi:hypothetical protein